MIRFGWFKFGIVFGLRWFVRALIFLFLFLFSRVFDGVFGFFVGEMLVVWVVEFFDGGIYWLSQVRPFNFRIIFIMRMFGNWFWSTFCSSLSGYVRRRINDIEDVTFFCWKPIWFGIVWYLNIKFLRIWWLVAFLEDLQGLLSLEI